MFDTEKTGSPTDTPQEVRFEIGTATLVMLTLVIAVFWLIGKLVPVFCVLITSFFIVCVLNSFVQRMEKRGFQRGTSILLAFLAALLAAVLLAFIIVPSVFSELQLIDDQMPIIRAEIAEHLDSLPDGSNLAKWVNDGKNGLGSAHISEVAIHHTLPALEIFAYFVSAIFMALYMMFERDRLRGGLFALVPRNHHVRLSRILLNLETIVGAYIRGQILTSLFIILYVFLLLSLLGIENPMAFAFAVGITDILPLIGVLLGAVVVTIAALSHGPAATYIVLAAMILYIPFENRVLLPRVYSDRLRLPASVVLVSVLVGATLLGIFGAILSLPVAATITMLIDEFRIQLPGENEPAKKEILLKEDARAEKEYESQTVGVPTEESAAIAVKIAEKELKDEVKIVHKKGGSV